MIDCVPVFARGAGFGNRLFQWARAAVYAARHGLRTVAPVWAFPRWRPFVLGGVDRTAYLNQVVLWNLFRPAAAERGPERQLLLRLFGDRLPEPQDLVRPPEPAGRLSYIPFRSFGDYFAGLSGHQEYLHRRLRQITNSRWSGVVRKWEPFARGAIGVNIRRGKDFQDARSPQDFFTRGALRTPLEWYADLLRRVRKAVGVEVPALLVSDGTAADLAPVLACGNVRFARPGSAISDLLLLSQTRVLLGAGGSSFSAWASFFGRMPTVTHPGQNLTWFGLKSDELQLVDVIDPAKEDDGVFERLVAPFRAAARDS